MSADGLIAAVKAKALSVDSIQCLAYLLAGRTGRRSDAIASIIGRRLSNGFIEQAAAEWLMSQSMEINLSIWDEVEPFVVS